MATKDIPKAREALGAILDDMVRAGHGHWAARVRLEVWHLLFRDPPMKKAAPGARRVTAQIRDAVKAFYPKNRHMRNREIGAIFGIDGGRVTEIMQGEYDDER